MASLAYFFVFRFREEGVRDVVRDVLLPWYHAFRFFVQMTTRYETAMGRKLEAPDAKRVRSSKNLMDQWIFGASQNLVLFVQNEMKAYRLYTVVPILVKFLDNLTNWYVRLNRERMRGTLTGDIQADAEDCCTALNVLFEVLFTTVRLMSPFTPFLTELMYQQLKNIFPADSAQRKMLSVHQLMMPEPETRFIDEAVEETIRLMQRIVVCGRTLREKKKVSLKTPLKTMVLVCPTPDVASSLELVTHYLRDELNVLDVQLKLLDPSTVRLSATPNFKVLGARVGAAMPRLCKAIQTLSIDEIQAFEAKGSLIVEGYTLSRDEISVKCQPAKGEGDDNMLVECVDRLVLMLDFTEDVKLLQMALAREIANRIQKLRKQANLTAEDHVKMYVALHGATLINAFQTQRAYIHQCLKREVECIENADQFKADHAVLQQQFFSINDQDSLDVIFTATSSKATDQQ